VKWLSELFARKSSVTTPRTTTQPPPPPAQARGRKDDSPDANDMKQVSDALSKFLDESEDGARLKQVRVIKAMGSKSLAPLLHEAFNEYGDPTRQNINIYKIRVAVWCGCALHPEKFNQFYRTKYQNGRSRMLDEMRAINMKDGMNGETYVHRLLDDASAADSNCSDNTTPAEPPAQSVEDLLKLGMKAYLGTEAPRDYAEARKQFLTAAGMGSAAAQNMIGVLFDNGFGVTQDYQSALRWFRLAAEQGYAPAEFCIGVMHRDGRGVPKDYAEAAKWIRKSAEQGNDEAQFNLGVMFLYGYGVTQDFQQAARWWRSAADQGNANARKNLDLLRSKGLY
jgi:TPR repeat protein